MIFDLYSKRAARLRGEVKDVYEYDTIPEKLKIQTIQIFSDVIGNPDDYYELGETRGNIQNSYSEIVNILRREHGVLYLHPSNKAGKNFQQEYFNYILTSDSPDQYLDCLEIGITAINFYCRKSRYREIRDADTKCNHAIEEINHRLKENGVGYEWSEGQIIRIDSELIHSEVVKPTLSFLNDAMYNGPRQEFLSAHEHYRSGRHKEAIVDCLKSFESVMKSICDKRSWPYDKGKATAKDLIKVCFDEGLVPAYWQNNLANLRALLESGIPTGRNKTSGHGQGSTPTKVDDSVAEYIMHMTASTILFMASAEKELT